MKVGPKCDTLFSEFWNGYAAQLHPDEFAKMTKYNLMRWAFREGFQARGDRDRKAAQSNTGAE
jgi:hypothetical protein